MAVANNKRVFSFELDILKIGSKPVNVGLVKQLDGTSFSIDLKNGEFPINLSDSLIRMFFKRPDGRSEFQKTQITVKDAINGRILIDCIDEIFEINGQVTLELEIINMHGYIETTPEFTVEVIDKIGDESDREIIRVQEVTLMQELKDYVTASAAYIDGFKTLLDEISSPDYNSLLEQLLATKETIEGLSPAVLANIETLKNKILEAGETQIVISNLESSVGEAEKLRESSEKSREANEEIRKTNEFNRTAKWSEILGLEQSIKDAELARESREMNRVENETARVKSEGVRELNEEKRKVSMTEMRNEIKGISDKVDGIPKEGKFDTDVVIKGNLFSTVDGVKPTLSGPATKDAGNMFLPYARAIAGMTKDGRGVRTLGFVAKPMDANPNLDITEEQNSDSVFLGTDVSQLFLYSKEKYPTIVSQGELSPIATQDWVMRLVEGLGLLKGGEDQTPTVTSSTPSEIFNVSLSDSWSSVMGTWMLDDAKKSIMLPNGQSGLYKPLIANSNINEVTYVAGGRIEGSDNDVFIGLWKTTGYIYGCRIKGNTLNISCFGTNGVRGGANTFTIRESVSPGDTVTLHYNFSNDIWEIYKFDANNEPTLIYQMSKFMMSGFPEFYNGKEVLPTLSILVNERGGMQFKDCPNPVAIKNFMSSDNYVF